MKLSHFFIERPIFAIVISVVTVLLARMLHRFPVWSVCPDDESSQAAERDS